MKTFIKNKLRNKLLTESEGSIFRLNDDGLLNKPSGDKIAPNTIYMDNKPIVDFGIGKIGTITINGVDYDKSIYLQGGYNAAAQKKGYGTIGLKFIFNKLPLIQHIILQCYDTACPFWKKMGGEEIDSKEISPGGPILRTLLIKKSDFESKQGL